MRPLMVALGTLPLVVLAADVTPSLAIRRDVAAYVVQRDSASRMASIADEAASIGNAIAASQAPEKVLKTYSAAYRAELARLGITGKNVAPICARVASDPDSRYLLRACSELKSDATDAAQHDTPAPSAGDSTPLAVDASRLATSAAVASASVEVAAPAAPFKPPAHGVAASKNHVPTRKGDGQRGASSENGAGGTYTDPLAQARLAVAVLAVTAGSLLLIYLRQRRTLRKLAVTHVGGARRTDGLPQEKTSELRTFSEPAFAPKVIGRYRALTAHGSWNIFHTTMQGRGHSRAVPPEPCQDSHRVHPISGDWGVAVVCDGAGSQACSQIGAEFVTQHLVELVSEKLGGTAMFRDRRAPSEEGWRTFAKALMLDTYLKLEAYVEEVRRTRPAISMDNVGCTVILVIYAPFGLLMAHIGDGQAGYRDNSGWHPMMTPFKGEYGNQTIFLTTKRIYSNQLENPDDPGNPFLETRVISAPVRAFTLMSDGMQNGLYETVIYDAETRENRVVNRPHGRAFEQIIERLCSFGREAGAVEKMQDEFLSIVDKGNKNLVQELDDKTLVLALCSS